MFLIRKVFEDGKLIFVMNVSHTALSNEIIHLPEALIVDTESDNESFGAIMVQYQPPTMTLNPPRMPFPAYSK